MYKKSLRLTKLKKGCMLALSALLIMFLVSCDVLDENIDVSQREAEPNKKQEEMSIAERNLLATNGCELESENHMLNMSDLSFSVNSVEVTKCHGDWKNLGGFGSVLTFDNDNRIEQGYSYVVIDVVLNDIKDDDFWINKFWLSYYSEENMQVGSIELCSTSILNNLDEEDLLKTDVFCLNISEDTSVSTKLIFVVEDDLLVSGHHFFLHYNPEGLVFSDADPNKQGMIFLETMEAYINDSMVEKGF